LPRDECGIGPAPLPLRLFRAIVKTPYFYLETDITAVSWPVATSQVIRWICASNPWAYYLLQWSV